MKFLKRILLNVQNADLLTLDKLSLVKYCILNEMMKWEQNIMNIIAETLESSSVCLILEIESFADDSFQVKYEFFDDGNLMDFINTLDLTVDKLFDFIGLEYGYNPRYNKELQNFIIDFNPMHFPEEQRRIAINKLITSVGRIYDNREK